MYQERIKTIRSKLNLSVAKMAEKIEIPARTITGYERGERMPSIEFLANLSIILNINANWFLTGKGNIFNELAQQDEQLEELVARIVDEKMKERGLI